MPGADDVHGPGHSYSHSWNEHKGDDEITNRPCFATNWIDTTLRVTFVSRNPGRLFPFLPLYLHSTNHFFLGLLLLRLTRVYRLNTLVIFPSCISKSSLIVSHFSNRSCNFYRFICTHTRSSYTFLFLRPLFVFRRVNSINTRGPRDVYQIFHYLSKRRAFFYRPKLTVNVSVDRTRSKLYRNSIRVVITRDDDTEVTISPFRFVSNGNYNYFFEKIKSRKKNGSTRMVVFDIGK